MYVMKPFHNSDVKQINLAPGQLYFGEAPALVHTLLGSCVAITLWHPETRKGGMCHYLLAYREAYQKNTHHQEGYYGTDALAYFVRQAKKQGLHRKDFEVKLFGGGNMFQRPHEHPDIINVAFNNLYQVRKLLEQYGFNVLTEDVGGVRYRKIYFELTNGDVWVQYGKHSKTTPV